MTDQTSAGARAVAGAVARVREAQRLIRQAEITLRDARQQLAHVCGAAEEYDQLDELAEDIHRAWFRLRVLEGQGITLDGEGTGRRP